jgi:hypothetical protein
MDAVYIERIDGDERRGQADTRRAVWKARGVRMERGVESALAHGGDLVHAAKEYVRGREECDTGMMMVVGKPLEKELAISARVHDASKSLGVFGLVFQSAKVVKSSDFIGDPRSLWTPSGAMP